MLNKRHVACAIVVAILTLAASISSGQQAYPDKPIRIITSEPGGGNDFVARLIAQGIAGPLGQSVIVDNRGSAVVGDLVAKASPDGYTMLVGGKFLWITPLLRKTSYDPVKDFSPIGLVARGSDIVVVHPSLPVKSIKELIALAKSKPGALNYAAPGTGTTQHLEVELFKSMAGVNIVHIPYKGGGPALTAVIGGEVQLMFASAPSVMPHIASGRLRALAVTSARPSPLAPDLPTVAASVPGYESDTVYGVFVPAKTPSAIIKRLNQEIVRVLGQEDVKAKLLATGVESAPSSPDELGNAIKSEMARLGKVIKDADIRAD